MLFQKSKTAAAKTAAAKTAAAKTAAGKTAAKLIGEVKSILSIFISIRGVTFPWERFSEEL